jgi:D-alanyl-D-alanine carboxypeptidase
MAQVGLLVTELKRYLKAQGITYAALGKQLDLSESSVKRLFARQSFSLQRLEQILNLLGLEIADLVTLMNERREFLTELTPEQEDALLADPKQLLMTYLLVNGWPLAEITNTFAIDEAEAERVLIRLHRARILELLPFNRVKLLRSRAPASTCGSSPVSCRARASHNCNNRSIASHASSTSSHGATRRCRLRSAAAAAPCSRCGHGSSRCSRRCVASSRPAADRRALDRGSTLEVMTSPDLNADLGIPSDYGRDPRRPRFAEAAELVDVEPNIVGTMQRLVPDTAAVWHQMKHAAAGAGVQLLLVSGFRSIQHQADIIRRKLAAGQSIDAILAVNAAPGFSEHHTGRAVDIATPGVRPLTAAFENSAAFMWLQANAVKFGFRMPYSRGNRFGFEYEPWHWSQVEAQGRRRKDSGA